MESYIRNFQKFSYRNYSMYGSQSDNICGRRCSKIACPGVWVKCSCMSKTKTKNKTK